MAGCGQRNAHDTSMLHAFHINSQNGLRSPPACKGRSAKHRWQLARHHGQMCSKPAQSVATAHQIACANMVRDFHSRTMRQAHLSQTAACAALRSCCTPPHLPSNLLSCILWVHPLVVGVLDLLSDAQLVPSSHAVPVLLERLPHLRDHLRAKSSHCFTNYHWSRTPPRTFAHTYSALWDGKLWHSGSTSCACGHSCSPTATCTNLH